MTEERGSGEAGAAEVGGREAAEAGGREAAEAWRRFGERDLRYAFASTTEALTHDLKNLVGAALMSLRACASRRAPGGPDEGGEFFDDALRTLEQGAKTLDRMRRLLEGPAGGPCLVAEAARGAAALLGP
ncbi:MAG TPA: hypothetical protein VFS00_18175, partial [Polyangiaceae bacterium]|nr:hypothetical protein [Polyangiaceae bacterium]